MHWRIAHQAGENVASGTSDDTLCALQVRKRPIPHELLCRARTDRAGELLGDRVLNQTFRHFALIAGIRLVRLELLLRGKLGTPRCGFPLILVLPCLEFVHGHATHVAIANVAHPIGERLSISLVCLASITEAHHDLVLIELSGIGVYLIDDKDMAGVMLGTNEHVDVVAVRATGTFEVTVIDGHLDFPLVTFRGNTGSSAALGVLNGNLVAMVGDATLLVVPGFLLCFGRCRVGLFTSLLYASFEVV